MADWSLALDLRAPVPRACESMGTHEGELLQPQ